MVAGVSARRWQGNLVFFTSILMAGWYSSMLYPSVCVWGYGKCQSQCSDTALGTGEQVELFFVKDALSGRQYLVDSGFQKSLLLPADSDLSFIGGGPQLIVANRSSNGTFGSMSVTVCFYGHTFNWEFEIASIAVPITGAESLCANGLLVDFANHHLIDAVSFATFLCHTGGFGPLMHASFFGFD